MEEPSSIDNAIVFPLAMSPHWCFAPFCMFVKFAPARDLCTAFVIVLLSSALLSHQSFAGRLLWKQTFLRKQQGVRVNQLVGVQIFKSVTVSSWNGLSGPGSRNRLITALATSRSHGNTQVIEKTFQEHPLSVTEARKKKLILDY